MKIEKVLEKLEEVLRGWEIDFRDWILFTNYASYLAGYKVPLRKGHLNIMVDKNKIPWKITQNEIAFETTPPKNSKWLKDYKNWEKETGFETSFVPMKKEKIKMIIKEDIFAHTLLSGRIIQVMKLIGELKNLDEHLAWSIDVGIGRKRIARLLGYVESYQKAAKEKSDKGSIRLARKILRKYKKFLKEEEPIKELKTFKKERVLRGLGVSSGQIKGKTRVIFEKRGLTKELRKIKKGEIIVCEMTTPKFISFAPKIKGIITDDGGILCHAAILSREFKVPCIIGTKIATKVLKDGDLIEVDAEKGIVKILEKAK